MAATATTSLLSIPNSTFKLKASIRKLNLFHYTPPFSYKSQPSPILRLQCSESVSVLQVEEKSEPATEAVSSASSQSSSPEEKEEEEKGKKRKLFVGNLPWDYTKEDIHKLFSECGKVEDVKLIKHRISGRSRGFAFVAMNTSEEALAVLEKFNSYELLDRPLKVEFSKYFHKPTPEKPPPNDKYKLFVSNIAFKTKQVHLKEFFSSFNPVSSRVIFDKANQGYGFVDFETKEDLEAAMFQLEGKELNGRPIRLRLSKITANLSEETQENSPEESQEILLNETQEISSEETQVSPEEP